VEINSQGSGFSIRWGIQGTRRRKGREETGGGSQNGEMQPLNRKVARKNVENARAG
jgi:hypothetical protein